MKDTSDSTHFVGVIQARVGSTRLPKKMILELANFPILEWVIRRVKESTLLDEVWLATSTLPENDALERIASEFGVNVFRGDEINVFSRFQEICSVTGASHIVRVCADNPLVCPIEINRVIGLALENPESYCFNHIPQMANNYVDGAGAEVVPRTYVQYMSEQFLSPQDLEHVTKYIWDHQEVFKLQTIPAPLDLSYPHVRLDVDTPADFLMMENRLRKVGGFGMPEELHLPKLVRWIVDNE